MIDFVKTLMKRKWDVAIIAVLLVVISTILPLSIKHVITTSVAENIAPLADQIELVSQKVSIIEASMTNEITERAVAAYSKIYTIEDLD